MVATSFAIGHFTAIALRKLFNNHLIPLVVGAVLMMSLTSPLQSPAMATQSSDFEYNFGNGPFFLASCAPGPSLRLTPLPLVPARIAPGKVDLRLDANWTNVWAKERSYFLDYETLDSRLTLTYGISRRWLVSLGFQQRVYFGGEMDNFIIEFHDLFGIDQDGRDKAPSGKSTLLLLDGNGHTQADLGSADRFNNSGVQLMSSFILHPGTKILPAICLSGVVQYGLETPFSDDEDPFDVGVGIGLSKRWSPRWFSYHAFHYTHYTQTDMPELTFEENGFSTTHALAWQQSRRLSFLLQYMYHEGVVKNLDSLSDPSHELGVGLKWKPGNSGVFEFGIIENIIEHANSPDFGVHGAYILTFN